MAGARGRDIDYEQRVSYVRRSYRNGRVKYPRTEASMRGVPLQARALTALDTLPRNGSPLVFPAIGGGYFDLHNFRTRYWYPALLAPGSSHGEGSTIAGTFATFALRAGISTFDLSGYMGASLTMIDRHYGHLARDGREHALTLLHAHNSPTQTQRLRRGRRVDVDEALRRRIRQQKQL
jgi:hypothetical protein